MVCDTKDKDESRATHEGVVHGLVLGAGGDWYEVHVAAAGHDSPTLVWSLRRAHPQKMLLLSRPSVRASSGRRQSVKTSCCASATGPVLPSRRDAVLATATSLLLWTPRVARADEVTYMNGPEGLLYFDAVVGAGAW
jgi:hypothetical protein